MELIKNCVNSSDLKITGEHYYFHFHIQSIPIFSNRLVILSNWIFRGSLHKISHHMIKQLLIWSHKIDTAGFRTFSRHPFLQFLYAGGRVS
jgi:hypothetical protein